MLDPIHHRLTGQIWRKDVAQQIAQDTPDGWAQRLLSYADELADIEPHMALTMRVCVCLLETAPFYTTLDMRRGVKATQDSFLADGLFVVRHLLEQGAHDQARGALEVVKHLAGVESPVPTPVPFAQEAQATRTPPETPPSPPRAAAHAQHAEPTRSATTPRVPATPLSDALRHAKARIRSFS